MELTDWLKMDPSNRPQPVWGESQYADYIVALSKRLNTYMEQAIIYGQPEEKEMEIGGDKCHLCGQDKMYGMKEFRVAPKKTYWEEHTAYQCGTELFDTYKVEAETGGANKRKRHIHVGSDCISVK